ncbi:hypothetical protein Poli38472_010706 [Pythium oligandrum]|uniref:TIR domain-containing protein n=1 Tax=Pythium oligandrum TaxID=41045 RepID=A0A8K1CFL0_PYTOL|nr:hypothetical protein Poli38472_010706 [Pythium oligandrum]|eukprot:TMW61643.1 hypothetical protein Poli38472_010706 [Pythium oligandrum]
MANIHYTVTRLSFPPPPSVLDANGLPLLNLQLDAIFSYQWGSQSTVLDVYQQGRVANLRAWFDVYGYMQGNVNSAMAAAVESVACVVVFVTDKYTQSVNCQLEFLYAAHLHKPFILVFMTDWRALALPSWMTDAVGTDFDIYPSRVDNAKATPDHVLALDFTAERINGLPMTTVLFSAIRVLAAERNNAPSPIAYDGSLLLYATTSALHHAMSSSNSVNDTQTPSSVVCTRCNTLFHPSVASSLDGCRVHSAYYTGGTLLAGRWVCCQETRTDGPGCQPATHTAITRTWTCDPAYGTYSCQPA